LIQKIDKKYIIQQNKMNTQSICIPRMENEIKRELIFSVFRKLKIGIIERITEIPLKNDEEHKRVIIKIKWNDTEQSKNIQTRLINGEPINIVYELPWFWKIVICNK